jgi:hypothetical protein
MIITKPMRNEAALAYGYGGDLYGAAFEYSTCVPTAQDVSRGRDGTCGGSKRRSTGMSLRRA